MKRTIFAGVATILTISLAQVAVAAPKATESVRERINSEVGKELKERLTRMGIMKNGAVSPVYDTQTSAQIRNQVNALINSATNRAGLNENRLEASIKRSPEIAKIAETILIAKSTLDREKSTGVSSSERKAEIASIESSIDLQIRMLNVATRLAITPNQATSAFKKIESLFPSMLTSFSLEERNSYNAILKKTVEQLENNNRMDVETALATSIKDVEGLRDQTALAKKLQEIIGCKI